MDAVSSSTQQIQPDPRVLKQEEPRRPVVDETSSQVKNDGTSLAEPSVSKGQQQASESEAKTLYDKSGFVQGETKQGLVEDEVRKDIPGANQKPEANEKAIEATGSQNLTKEELKQVESLKKRDAEVKAHEQAHANVGGSLTSAPTYTYETGPDGRRYAVAGEVSIDTSKVEGDPEATLEKARQIKEAALAPAVPSDQDRKVAAEASQLAREAQSEIIEEKTEPAKSDEASEAVNTSQDKSEASAGLDGSTTDGSDLLLGDELEGAGELDDFEFQDGVTEQSQNSNIESVKLNQPAGPVLQTTDASEGAEEVVEDSSDTGITTADSDEQRDDVSRTNRLFVSVSEQSRAIELFEATQALYQNVEEQGGINRSDSSSAAPGDLVNTLV